MSPQPVDEPYLLLTLRRYRAGGASARAYGDLALGQLTLDVQALDSPGQLVAARTGQGGVRRQHCAGQLADKIARQPSFPSRCERSARRLKPQVSGLQA